MPVSTSDTADLFKRGFIWGEVGGAATSWTARWLSSEVAGTTLRHHPLTPFRTKIASGVRIHCLGMICDVFDLGLDDDAVVQRLADALATSWTEFYRRLKTTGGSYALLVETDRLYVVLDACGTVPVVHGLGALASHPRLIAEGRGVGMSELARGWITNPALQAGGHYLPGLLTPYDGIEVVMPNHRLDVRTGEMDRFYPDTDFVIREPDDIVARVSPALGGQLERLDRPLAIGLSGGMDSRLTLAASRPVHTEAQYFTYYKPDVEILLRDVEVAGQLAADLQLNHQTLAIPELGPPEMERDFALVTDGLRGPANLLSTFVTTFPDPTVHVRSNILETIRGFWLKNPANRKDAFDATTLHRLFRRASPTEFIPHFADYIERIQYDTAAFRGFHWADMFYWEHRMGAWLGPTIRGEREAWDTYVIYNSRALLELMMSRPLEDRISAQLVSLLMEDLWPEVLGTPVFSGSKFVDLRQPGRAEAADPGRAPLPDPEPTEDTARAKGRWGLVGSSPGTPQTILPIRRPKPRTTRGLVAVVALVLGLVGAMAIGAVTLTGDNRGPDASLSDTDDEASIDDFLTARERGELDVYTQHHGADPMEFDAVVDDLQPPTADKVAFVALRAVIDGNEAGPLLRLVFGGGSRISFPTELARGQHVRVRANIDRYLADDEVWLAPHDDAFIRPR